MTTTTDPYGITDLYDSDLSQSYSIFLPCVTVFDNGDIDIDFSDCYLSTTVEGDTDHAEPEGNPHSTLLDSLVAGRDHDPVGALRRLADYIANQRRPEFPVDDVEDNVCPQCGRLGVLQYTDTDIRFWEFARFDDRTMLFHGEFDWVGDGEGDHIVCAGCQAEWKPPATVDFI